MVYKNQIVVEKAADYLGSIEAPKRVYEFNKTMKLILILRSPVKRAISHFTHGLHSKEANFDPNKYDEVSKTFEKRVLHDNGDVDDKSTFLIKLGMYVIHYKRWLEYFPKEQILILNGENFVLNPYEEVKKVEGFLNLKNFFQKNHFGKN